MMKRKNEESKYLGKYLSNLENLPINKDTMFIADAITSIDKHTYRKDWMRVYKKSRKLIEYMEEKTEINNEENHYFLHLSSLLETLYWNTYSTLVKMYKDISKMSEEELDSMDEFVATTRERFGEIIPPTPRTAAYNRLMRMTRDTDDQGKIDKHKVVIEKMENIKAKLDQALVSAYLIEDLDSKSYSEFESKLLDAETSIAGILDRALISAYVVEKSDTDACAEIESKVLEAEKTIVKIKKML